MSEFVGRTGSLRVYSYPEPRFTGLVGPFARNAAAFVSEGAAVPVAPGAQISWTIVAVGSPGTDVPITPKATGALRITGEVVILNSGGANQIASVQVELDGVAVSSALDTASTIPANGGETTIPIFAEAAGVVGVISNIQIRLTKLAGGASTLLSLTAQLDIQEVVFPTG